MLTHYVIAYELLFWKISDGWINNYLARKLLTNWNIRNFHGIHPPKWWKSWLFGFDQSVLRKFRSNPIFSWDILQGSCQTGWETSIYALLAKTNRRVSCIVRFSIKDFSKFQIWSMSLGRCPFVGLVDDSGAKISLSFREVGIIKNWVYKS